MNIQAAATFSNITSDISNNLETLRGLAEDHFAQDPDCVNWGHVGTLRAILNDIESASMRATALAFPRTHHPTRARLPRAGARTRRAN